MARRCGPWPGLSACRRSDLAPWAKRGRENSLAHHEDQRYAGATGKIMGIPRYGISTRVEAHLWDPARQECRLANPETSEQGRISWA